MLHYRLYISCAKVCAYIQGAADADGMREILKNTPGLKFLGGFEGKDYFYDSASTKVSD